MIDYFKYNFRYLTIHARRKGRLAFSSREALSLVFLAGLPFVMMGSISINKTVNSNMAYAYVAEDSGRALTETESGRLSRQIAMQVRAEPDTLLRLGKKEVSLILDRPGLERSEGNMGVLQYRTDSCVLDLYIGDEAVTHYEMRARGKVTDMRAHGAGEMSPQEKKDCIRNILAGHDGLKSLVFASR